jgi:hypothetical protein
MATAIHSHENGDGCSLPAKWLGLFASSKMATAVRRPKMSMAVRQIALAFPRKWRRLFAGDRAI